LHYKRARRTAPKRHRGEDLELIVEDDGVGIKDGQAPRGSGLGLKINSAMVHTLGVRRARDVACEGLRRPTLSGQCLWRFGKQ
jgi:two-component sensor histidine kinase